MSFIRLSRWLLPVSALLVAASAVLLFVPGPLMSVEFTGGTLMEWSLPSETSAQDLQDRIASYREDRAWKDSIGVSRTTDGTFLIRLTNLTNEEHTELVSSMETSLEQDIDERQFTTIGPTVGASLKQRSFWALIMASVAIVLYLTLAFRKIPRSLSPWTFGISAIIALIHDIMITAGIFTVLSHFTSFQVDTLFMTALLSIMGYSVNDTIVIFDRFRDNLIEQGKREDLEPLAEQSLRQTLGRTFNTTFSTLIVLFSLLFFGSHSIFWFILTLIIGTLIGTYSSYFVATPLLVRWKKARSSGR